MYLRRLCQLTLIVSILSYSPVIKAQEVSEEQLNLYAKAVMEIESERQQAYEEIETILGESPPEIVCNQPRSYNRLPEAASRVAIAYCETSEEIVTSNGLSVREFNQITQKIQENEELERFVQQVIMDLQKQ